MNESLVLSRDLSQKLVEAGVYIDRTFAWVRCEDVVDAKYFAEDSEWVLVMMHDLITLLKPNAVKYPAPLTDELLRVMPSSIEGLSKTGAWLELAVDKSDDGTFMATYGDEGIAYIYCETDTPVNALGSLVLVPEVLEVVKKNMKEGKDA